MMSMTFRHHTHSAPRVYNSVFLVYVFVGLLSYLGSVLWEVLNRLMIKIMRERYMTKRRSKDLNTGLWKSDFEKIFSKSLLSMEWELTHYTLPRQKK